MIVYAINYARILLFSGYGLNIWANVRHKHSNQKINPLNAEIIGKAKDDRKLLIKEWILIKNQKPSLNTQFARELGKFSRNLNMIRIDHLV